MKKLKKIGISIIAAVCFFLIFTIITISETNEYMRVRLVKECSDKPAGSVCTFSSGSAISHLFGNNNVPTGIK